jgi:uncharacterized protein (TIGR02118 family)
MSDVAEPPCTNTNTVAVIAVIMVDSDRPGSPDRHHVHIFCNLASDPACYAAAMIRMSVLYPAADGATFDHDYYRDHHVPLCVDTWAPAKTEIDRGIEGPHVAAVHFYFDSMDALGAAMASPGLAEIQADVAKYTSITPVIQTSEIVA